MQGRRKQDDVGESRRILERVSRETDVAVPAFLHRTARRFRDHVSAVNADESDPIEYWGTRIGRSLGLVLTVVIIITLAVFVIRGG